MTKYLIRHFDVLSVAKIGAVVSFVLWLIEGIILGAIAGAAGPAAAATFQPFMMGLGIGGLIVFFAIIIGLIGGFIMTAIRAFVYNCAAKYAGPVEVDLDMKA